jgi:hypothetical protein
VGVVGVGVAGGGWAQPLSITQAAPAPTSLRNSLRVDLYVILTTSRVFHVKQIQNQIKFKYCGIRKIKN